jgi:copper(I)-binding protein
MMTRFLAAVTIAALSVSPALAQKTLSASDAWVKAPAAGESSAAAFVVVDNPTMYDVYVVSAESDVAASVTFVEPAKSGGGKPQPVEHLIAPAYSRLELTPDGPHMLLNDLKKPLAAGESITITLTTDGGEVLEAQAVVK